MFFKQSFWRHALMVCALLFIATPIAGAQIETRADYAIIMEAETGEVLYAKDADVAMAPASMSKLMTIEMVFKALRDGTYTLDDPLQVSRKAWKMGGSKMWVLVDTEIRIEDLLRGIIVQSGNDACVVVAEGFAGSEDTFADQMTSRGREIGLTNSTFRNSTGWPHPEHKMSTRDLAVLARHLVNEYPDYYPYFSEKEFTWGGITQPNRNRLLNRNIGADGLKTGHTEESGYGMVTSAVKNGRRLIVVLNGLNSEAERETESRRMLNVGFREFKRFKLFKGGDRLDRAAVWNGVSKRVGMTVKDDVHLTLHRSLRKDVKVTLHYTGPLKAPITKGDEIGYLMIDAPGKEAERVPLLADADVEKAGIGKRIGQAISYLLYGPPPM